MSSDVFKDLRSAYLLGETIAVKDLPNSSVRGVVRTAMGDEVEEIIVDGSLTFNGLPIGTHTLETLSKDGVILGEELFGIREFVGDDPVMGFVTSFDELSVPSTLSWLRDLRCTVVQVYDWMDSYSEPLSMDSSYEDPLGRHIEKESLIGLIQGIKAIGAVAQAYAPVIAADEDLAVINPEWRLFRSDGNPQSLGDLLQIMDPGSPSWQRHWIDRYGTAADALGFDGFHLDTYGYPRVALDVDGTIVDVVAGYEEFVSLVRQMRPKDVISFNQVNGVPRGFNHVPRPNFRYVEVWPPNNKFRHLEGLLERSAGDGQTRGNVLAVYPPVWSSDRQDALRTCLIVESVSAMLGASTLLWGDLDGVLNHPYYVTHETLDGRERSIALEWHRFALRYRDLFRTGVDTSWFELEDENASVTISWDGETLPEPVEGTLFVRVLRTTSTIVVGLLDLTGSVDGSWLSGMGRGRVEFADVSVLLNSPERWRIDAASVMANGGRFAPVEFSPVTLREGEGIICRVALTTGWTILRLALGEP